MPGHEKTGPRRTLQAPGFKARCLAILGEVQRSGEGLTILKRGRRVAQLLPVSPREAGAPQATLRGAVTVLGDIIGPVLPAEDWEAEGPAR